MGATHEHVLALDLAVEVGRRRVHVRKPRHVLLVRFLFPQASAVHYGGEVGRLRVGLIKHVKCSAHDAAAAPADASRLDKREDLGEA